MLREAGPDAGPHASRGVRPALRDRGAADGRGRGPGRAAGPDRGRGMTGAAERVDVAIVGGGPAGAVLAARLARAPASRSSSSSARRPGTGGPAASSRRRRPSRRSRARVWIAATLAEVARPIPAMRVETPGGTTFRLTYGTETGGPPGRRVRPLAAGSGAARRWRAAAGADVRRRLDGHRGRRRRPAASRSATRTARSVVVARVGRRRGGRAALGRGARRPASPAPARLDPRIGLTYHLADADPTAAATPGCGSCATATSGSRRCPAGGSTSGSCSAGRGARPWPGTARGPSPTAIVAAIPPTADDAAALARRRRRSTPSPAPGRSATASPDAPGRGWLLVGDAAGFLDPFTGEGLHRALVSAELAAAAILAHRRGGHAATAPSPPTSGRCSAGSWPRTRCRGSSRRFLGRPALFEYAARRVAARPAVRATMGLVMGDLVPAGRALDPRFLAALLAP